MLNSGSAEPSSFQGTGELLVPILQESPLRLRMDLYWYQSLFQKSGSLALCYIDHCDLFLQAGICEGGDRWHSKKLSINSLSH